jgi:Xaa-Pro aminopeptidase
MKYLPLNPKYLLKQERFIKEMKPGSIAIFVSNDRAVNGDALYPLSKTATCFG